MIKIVIKKTRLRKINADIIKIYECKSCLKFYAHESSLITHKCKKQSVQATKKRNITFCQICNQNYDSNKQNEHFEKHNKKKGNSRIRQQKDKLIDDSNNKDDFSSFFNDPLFKEILILICERGYANSVEDSKQKLCLNKKDHKECTYLDCLEDIIASCQKLYEERQLTLGSVDQFFDQYSQNEILELEGFKESLMQTWFLSKYLSVILRIDIDDILENNFIKDLGEQFGKELLQQIYRQFKQKLLI